MRLVKLSSMEMVYLITGMFMIFNPLITLLDITISLYFCRKFDLVNVLSAIFPSFFILKFCLSNVESSKQCMFFMCDLFSFRKFSGPCTGYFDVCCNVTIKPLDTTTEKTERPQGCGYHNPGLSPWTGALFYQESHQRAAPGRYKCGFSLIHPRVGMTAAHCLQEDDGEAEGSYYVKIGKKYYEYVFFKYFSWRASSANWIEESKGNYSQILMTALFQC